ncbi:uncharacterized protein BP5553_07952 [Venustampulla echinocandica]|uniref:Uncharacterized protein n=1 Tax=Venustampulla echinocandica TaxID=2656787 RepID=A0A370TFB0_9HELO|nr:uncharacterized protein BP5553_07952 [Venustampulla echinocandica]RDL33584.1 hypothetical protein BP5553_07952 [Venustampulla echinocandica]
MTRAAEEPTQHTKPAPTTPTAYNPTAQCPSCFHPDEKPSRPGLRSLEPELELPAMLPPPTLSFTIPSIHDNLVLQCRVYHPKCLAPDSVSQIETWRKKAAIIAHPYAPLGGSYDDPVVDLIAGTILQQGFCVGTFNFRGAGSSKGRTSWQSKAEQNDYMSFIGFMIYYMHHLSGPRLSPSPIDQPVFSRSDSELPDLSPIPSQTVPPPHTSDPRYNTTTPGRPGVLGNGNIDGHYLRCRLLLGGYSYGAMVTSCLPAIMNSFLEPFQNPSPGSAFAEIRLRAEFLALQQNEVIQAHISSLLQSYGHRSGRNIHLNGLHSPRSRKSTSGVRVGGEEDLRRASHDSYRSRSSFTIETQERVRKSVDRVRSLTKRVHLSQDRGDSDGAFASPHENGPRKSDSSGDEEATKSTAGDEETTTKEEKSIIEIPGIADEFQPAYLLVSPLQGMINNLATMWSGKPLKERRSIHENEIKFTIDPTLALFGDDDVFVSVKRLRSWVEKLMKSGKGGDGGHFRYREVANAGHFWHDHDASKILEEEVRSFVCTL